MELDDLRALNADQRSEIDQLLRDKQRLETELSELQVTTLHCACVNHCHKLNDFVVS